MSKLKELTWENHQRAERTNMARKLLKGMTPEDYYKYLVNQLYIYSALESAAEHIMKEFPAMARVKKIIKDVDELERMFNIEKNPMLITNTAERYAAHVSRLDRNGLLAHIYVRHFGDMYGGQIIKNRNPGSGLMYNFDKVDELKTSFRALLNDDMAEEANRCFEFAMQLFEELDSE